MKQVIQTSLYRLGDHSAIKAIQKISGGDINEAFYVLTHHGEYFVKGNNNVPPHFFKIEALGLDRIAQTDAINVPKVYDYNQPGKGETGFIVLEWIEEEVGNSRSVEQLGTHLANLHQHTADHFGFDQPTFIGELTQENHWRDSWVEYYRDDRMQPQLQLAVEHNTLPLKRRERLEQLLSRLDQLLPHHPSPSLLHGDLWGGNYLVGRKGVPYLIDPSILYGDHAFELAFTELFGGFPPPFYAAYEEVMPLPYGYEDMKPLYQLYYLLVHLNMFGESYGPPVDRILARYTEN
ncbi:fructosamine kinase family protein [Halobacillus naozhouensis]|uniref:Fructosamine kinase family protein n=1 Tax=Halobacillus naozhouensis TaxID=554880 RepID=A0ABY8IYU3_9BACI|nr:fructosamine kinase family protein [Halobacillus naozhouensis]WFT74464.1 fructosamine kinase family protein [Halobacillus naozhouensis]